MPHVSTISIFDVERITVRWDAELKHYQVVFEGANHRATTINAWWGSGEERPPELIVEAAPEPVDLPNEELDV